uniref:Uncharacterized protein n=1 Tax=Nothobranchius pienaari TaxID=704102 RepID=A0A1A8Q9Q7_9TELE
MSPRLSSGVSHTDYRTGSRQRFVDLSSMCLCSRNQERRSSEARTLRPTHAVHETPSPLPAVVFRLGPAASDQPTAVLLLLRWTWRVEPEDAAVWKLWSVVSRGLHTVSNEAFALRGQVLSVPVFSLYKGT